MRPPLETWLNDRPIYDAYTYSYPHKTSYRAFDPPRALDELWANEDRSSLFLYLHVPFCEMRCGFCNLFTRVRDEGDLSERFVRAVERQARVVRSALGSDARFSRLAFGGGTPTFLAPAQLSRLFDVAHEIFGATALPTSLETSPETIDDEHLALAKSRGVDRISIGIQSFFDAELAALGRPLRGRAGVDALDRIRTADIPTLNVDLIYGIEGQSAASFVASIDKALIWSPEELYLYPLYVRPLTGLGRRAKAWDDLRLECYREGRRRLLDRGYDQISTRLFRRADAPQPVGPEYSCQDDGMVGLGCGARSYTTAVHYSDDWAVSATEVRAILAEWVTRDERALATATYGATLDAEEQQTRYFLKSVLNRSGLDRAAYTQRFGVDVEAAWPELAMLVEQGLLVETTTGWFPTALGLERGDQIGPWLYSSAVRAAMRGFRIR